VLAFDRLAAAQNCSVSGLLVPAARPSFMDTKAVASRPETWQVAGVVGSGEYVRRGAPDGGQRDHRPVRRIAADRRTRVIRQR
jgi:hypothetical protein